MKIKVENEKEKSDLIKVSKYLHDFNVYRGKRKTVKLFQKEGKSKKVKKKSLTFLELDSVVGNYLMHIYLTPEMIDMK